MCSTKADEPVSEAGSKQITSNRKKVDKHPEMIALKKRQSAEMHEFAETNIFWSFGNDPIKFNEGMKKIGLSIDETDKLIEIAGGAMRKDKLPELIAMKKRHKKEVSELRKMLETL